MRIAIVGAGFSGSQLALELVRVAGPEVEIVLIERRGRFGPGRAYSARSSELLLNTRAQNLGVYEEDHGHFVRWLAANKPQFATGPDFVPRRLFGEYLSVLIEDARRPASFVPQLRLIEGQAVGIDRHDNGMTVRLTTGQCVSADRVVLCAGMQPPALPEVPRLEWCNAGRCIMDPWNESSIHRIGRNDKVLVMGTGLTMVDAVLLLEAQGHVGPVLAFSRRGLLPTVHQITATAGQRHWPALLGLGSDQAITMRALLRRVRAEVARAAAQGVDWRVVVDAIRPSIGALWQRLPAAERLRFLRHVRPYWEAHRHRMPPASAARIAARRHAGALEIRAGRILAFEPCQNGIKFAFQERRAGVPTSLAGDWLINCSGPTGPTESCGDPLIRSLLDDGLARLDRLGLGLEVAAGQRVVDRNGAMSDRLFALGPMARGIAWEATAVPEIRAQGSQLAKLLASSTDEPREMTRRSSLAAEPARLVAGGSRWSGGRLASNVVAFADFRQH